MEYVLNGIVCLIIQNVLCIFLTLFLLYIVILFGVDGMTKEDLINAILLYTRNFEIHLQLI